MRIGLNYKYTGGNRGWAGDVSKMRLSIEKLVHWDGSHRSQAMSVFERQRKN